MKIAPTDKGFASPDAQAYNPITPPILLESRPVPSVTEPREDVGSNPRGHRTTRAQKRRADALEEPMDVNQKARPRKTRRKY